MSAVERTLRAKLARGLDRASVADGAAVVVAFSGGPDSMALADLLRRAPSGRVGAIALVYIDHQLRPTELDVAHIQSCAAAWGLEHRVIAVDVDRDRASLEAAMREARYRALEEVADEIGADVIATGHTVDDQAETVVLRMLRGTGVEGLAGIAWRRGRIARPLLDVGRDELVAYLEARGLSPVIDPTNAEAVFARNRVRQTIMPLLATENPKLAAALGRLANSAREIRVLIDERIEAVSAEAATEGGLDTAAIAAAPALIGKRVLARAAEAAGARDLEADHLEALWELARGPARGSASLDLPNCRALREYETLRFEAPTTAPAELPPLSVVGPERYEVRVWRPGDRMRPVRLCGKSRKLSDLYIDAKIPRRLREQARVVVRAKDGVIEWAEHVGPAFESPVEVTGQV